MVIWQFTRGYYSLWRIKDGVPKNCVQLPEKSGWILWFTVDVTIASWGCNDSNNNLYLGPILISCMKKWWIELTILNGVCKLGSKTCWASLCGLRNSDCWGENCKESEHGDFKFEFPMPLGRIAQLGNTQKTMIFSRCTFFRQEISRNFN